MDVVVIILFWIVSAGVAYLMARKKDKKEMKKVVEDYKDNKEIENDKETKNKK